MHRIAHLPLTLFATLVLAACSSEPAPVDSADEADAFAARINANTPTPTPAPAATVAPRIAQPLPGAAPGPFMPGTATDPAAANCGANRMGPFIGKLADEPTRLEIVKTLGRSDNLRFVAFGSGGFINPDPTNPRLSLMLDAQNIIRDARCG
ncbi:hypothetical protein SOQ14_12295 [Erythrobacter sp. T5W1-R]|uniref:hypothetical protein n=1 Tax=Erythrobacter sp. T5W1-R TaxID=3101752 RepID=UPI002B002B61|nr:hypothetical protein [Erythrobacter sp. T5W1-R]MEA1619699.1 hypothetical protein [Erythrobacter sp. T5W1-R]